MTVKYGNNFIKLSLTTRNMLMAILEKQEEIAEPNLFFSRENDCITTILITPVLKFKLRFSLDGTELMSCYMETYILDLSLHPLIRIMYNALFNRNIELMEIVKSTLNLYYGISIENLN